MKIKILTIVTICVSAFLNAQTPKVEWTKAIGGTGNERANGIETDSKGNIIIVGRFQSTKIMLDNITLTKNTSDNADFADIFIIKLDKNGKALWAVSAGDKGDDHATSCVTDKKGNIYVVGWFESKKITFDNVTLNNKTEKGSDMYVAKFSPRGRCIWAKNAGGDGGNGDYSTISLDNQNNVVVAGIAGKIMGFGNGVKLITEKGGMYVAKYSNDGDLLWAKGATNGECQGVGTDNENNIYAGGYFSDKTTFGNIGLTSNGKSDAYVVKYSPSGNVLWAKKFGGDDGEISTCETDKLGNVYLSGLFFSKTITTEKSTLTNNGLINAFIAKFDKDGNLIWTKSAGGNNGEAPATATREFYVDENGNAFCTGSNWSEFTFAGKTIKPVAGSEDIFILKYDKYGNELWGVDYGGTGRNAGRGITTDKNGNIFLTGSFDEKALKIENQTLTNVGDSDIFIVKFSEQKK
ncbi:MAG: hypothetical protein OJF59_003150 [Cytophagales bacterium]|jgi:hypothetical protein|nr:hypothetical protein [Bacteroidota bacterium]MBS1981944.1 hypothetical protein [Bacteroidota bacterium]WHZ09394.1 MAG: hypothetical protein OJF59_003150 [Cytophagales bacterium]